MRSFILVALGLMILLGMGCTMNSTVTVKGVAFREFKGAMQISDGFVEAIVVPQGGRVMWFGKRGGENVLWVNPDLAGPTKGTPDDWANYGGDKVWPWPQGGWEKGFGRRWPPAAEFDADEFVITPIDGGVRMEGKVSAAQRVRVIREIKLVGGGRLRTWNRIEAVGPGSGMDMSPWTVTQLARPDVAEIVGVTATKPLPEPNAEPWAGAHRENTTLILPGKPGPATKLGADASGLRFKKGAVEFHQRIVSATPGHRDAAEAVQIYRGEFAEAPKPQEYIEFEFTAPTGPITAGMPRELVVEWELK